MTALSAASAQTYKAVGEYKLNGSTAKGIAVDSDGRRLFVGGDDGVTVLNADTGASIGIIAGLMKVQDVLLIPEMNGDERAPSTKGFASDASGHVIVFSMADLKPTATLRVETAGESSVCYDDDAKTVEVVGTGGSLATIDATTNKVIKSGKLTTGMGQAVCGNLARVYVADPAANVVHVLNHDTMRNEGDYRMETGSKPSGLAIDTKGRRLFVSCEDGTVEVIDTDAGFTFIELKSGSGIAHGTFTWLPQGKGQWKAATFFAQDDGTLSGVRMNAFINYSLGGAYKLTPGLGAIAYDDKTHHLYMTSMTAGAPVVVVAGY